MCRLERNTARRGRSAVPLTFVRVRTWRRTRASCLVLAFTWPHPPPSRSPGLRGLAGLLAHVLVLVADALALVRLGLAHLPDVRGDLADELLVVAANDDRRWGRNLELDALRRRERNGVRVTHLQLERVAAHRGAVADTDDGQALLVPLRYALDHVRDERAREAMQAPVESLITRSLDADRGVLLDDAHLGMETRAERSARALHGHRGVLDRDVDPARDLDGLSADTTHIATPATKRTRGPRRRCPCGRRHGPSSHPATSTRWRRRDHRARAGDRSAPRTFAVPDCSHASTR